MGICNFGSFDFGLSERRINLYINSPDKIILMAIVYDKICNGNLGFSFGKFKSCLESLGSAEILTILECENEDMLSVLSDIFSDSDDLRVPLFRAWKKEENHKRKSSDFLQPMLLDI